MTSYFNMTDITYGTNDVHTLSIILSNIICWTEYEALQDPCLLLTLILKLNIPVQS